MRQDGSSQFRLVVCLPKKISEEVIETDPQVSLESLNSTFYSVPPPGSGAILAYILNILDLYRVLFFFHFLEQYGMYKLGYQFVFFLGVSIWATLIALW